MARYSSSGGGPVEAFEVQRLLVLAGEPNAVGPLSELAAHVQDLVPQIRVDKRDGVVKIMRGIIPVDNPEGDDPAPTRQSARFGSRGENFVVAKRLTVPAEAPAAQ